MRFFRNSFGGGGPKWGEVDPDAKHGLQITKLADLAKDHGQNWFARQQAIEALGPAPIPVGIEQVVVGAIATAIGNPQIHQTEILKALLRIGGDDALHYAANLVGSGIMPRLIKQVARDLPYKGLGLPADSSAKEPLKRLRLLVRDSNLSPEERESIEAEITEQTLRSERGLRLRDPL